MRVHLAIIFSLICGPAMADGNGDIFFSTTVPIGDQPTPVGQPHICSGTYPLAAIKAYAEGTTALAFTVATDGNVKNPKVEKSSGNKDLDDASLQCVTLWHYRPAERDSKPIEVPWKANVVWKLHDSAEVRRAETCLEYRKVPTKIPPGIGATSLVFRVMPDGTVTDAAIAWSSGDQSLDDAALLCATASRLDVSIFTFPPEGIPGHGDWDWAHVLLPASSNPSPPSK